MNKKQKLLELSVGMVESIVNDYLNKGWRVISITHIRPVATATANTYGSMDYGRILVLLEN